DVHARSRSGFERQNPWTGELQPSRRTSLVRLARNPAAQISGLHEIKEENGTQRTEECTRDDANIVSRNRMNERLGNQLRAAAQEHYSHKSNQACEGAAWV